MRLIALCLTALLTALFASGASAADAPAVKGPLAPAEAVKHFRIAPGLRIELVAAEPQLESPVAMAFDEDGRLWVVEMLDYPNGPAKGEPPQGRIKLLEDRDGDGRYEHASVFADGLLFANGLLPWKGGLIVTAAPHILYLRDTDGDGKADHREVLYEGFAAQNPQLRVSHPVLGMDNWVYVANGLRGGQVIRAGKKGAAPLSLSGRDFRFDPVGDRAEAISGMGQYGNTFDDWGNRFVCDNRHHLRHVVLADRHLKRNPLLAVASVLEDVSELEVGVGGGGARIYPLSKNWTTSNLHEGRFTAACGVFVYRGTVLPEPFRGAAFTCDPTGNLVHQEVLTPAGATFRGKPAFEGREFLATPDDWCRPVFLSHGPDGAMYVVDMYRAVIEHPEFMPVELKNRPDLLLGKDRGRIWRIVPDRAAAKQPRPSLAKAGVGELAALLEHPEAWWRTTAQRLLLERRDAGAVEPLRKLCTSSKSPLARAQAAWLLQSQDALDEETVCRLLADESPRVREQALLLGEPRLASSPRVREAALRLADDADARVRFQFALSIGEWDDPAVVPALAKVALAGAEDRWTRIAVATAVPARAGELAAALARAKLTERPTPGRSALLQELAALVGSRRDPAEVVALVGLIGSLDAAGQEPWQRAALLGLTEGMARRGVRLEAFLRSPPPAQQAALKTVEGLFARAAGVSADASRPVDQRVEATRLLAHAPATLARPALEKLLAPDGVPELRLVAVRALAASPSADVGKLLMASWASATPALRQELAEAMLRNPERSALLLAEVEAGRVKPREIDSASTRRLVNHARPELRARSRKLLQTAGAEERKKVLERFRPAAAAKGDPAKGREVFRQNCASCHRIAGIGFITGPDISDTRTKTAEMLLTDILDPNAAIDANYVGYQVTMKDGKALSGLITSETASSITLRRDNNQTDVLLRQDVEELRSTGQSLMPEGLEKTVSVEQMADLLAFLKNWRYLDGAVPLGAAPKK